MVIYEDNQRILTTCDETLPMIEIDSNYSSHSINTDLQFFIKLSFNWSEIENYQNLIEQTISTASLNSKYQMVNAVRQMQVKYHFRKF